MPESAAIPLPPKATATFFYKYSGSSTPEHLERLRVIVQEHEIYLPTLPQLNDPADGRPRLAPLSEDEMSSFLYTMFVHNNPQLSQAELEHHREIIFYNVKRHGTKTLLKDMTEILHRDWKVTASIRCPRAMTTLASGQSTQGTIPVIVWSLRTRDLCSRPRET
jgi:hypothetical protein